MISVMIRQKVAFCICASMAFVLIYVYDEHIGHESESNQHRDKVLKSITSKIDNLINTLQGRLTKQKMLEEKNQM